MWSPSVGWFGARLGVDQTAPEQTGPPPQSAVPIRVQPNPYRPGASAARVAYGVLQRGPARLVVYDALGRAVRTLIDDGDHPAGEFVTEWDGRGDGGSPLSAGVYVLHLRTPSGETSRATTLVR